MKILLTGASGFVGQNLCVFFSERGHTIKKLSLRESFGLEDLSDADIIIHLAGKAHDLNDISNSEEYYRINFDLTCELYTLFLASNARKFIFMSSVKAAADDADTALTENIQPAPFTHYGKSKLMAENFIRSLPLPSDKSFFILRPCMIHGLGNKGNLNLLYKVVSKGLPWPLGAFENKRSFLSIENLCFIIKELTERIDIPSGIYNLSDNDTLSTNALIETIAEALEIKPLRFNIPRGLIVFLAKIGTILHLPLNTNRLKKLTSNYIVSNKKLLEVLKKPLPLEIRAGITLTIQSFKKSNYISAKNGYK